MRLIDVDELLEQLETLLKKRDEEARYCGYRGPTVTWNDALYAITNAPTVDRVKHGRWKYFDDETIEDGGYCSVCLHEQPMFWEKKTWRYVETGYCPNCGAYMMDGENNEID